MLFTVQRPVSLKSIERAPFVFYVLQGRWWACGERDCGGALFVLGRRRSYREMKGIDMITWTNYEALSDPQHAGWGLNQKGKKY